VSDMIVAMILSFFLPGIGQAYLTKKWVKGIIYFVLSCVLSIILIGILLWLYGLYDTFEMSEAIDKKTGYKSPIFG
jgi:hypothetical protein